MSSGGQVIPFEDYRTGRSAEGEKNKEAILTPRVYREDARDRRAPENSETTFEDLYPPDISSSILIKRVGELLQGAAENAASALQALQDGDALGADQQTMLMQGRLPELFCCREVSEGLSAVVLGLFYGLQNLHGAPLNLDQAYTISRVLSALSASPFISFEASLDILNRLENEGMEIDPPEAAHLSDLLDAEVADE